MMMKTAFGVTIATILIGGAALAGPGKLSKADKDGDGRVSVEEIDERHRDFLSKADADKDGFITEEEMRALHESKRAEMKEKLFPDADKNGYVDRYEFEEAARARFAQLDKNGDGRLSEEEARAGHMRGHGHRGRP